MKTKLGSSSETRLDSFAPIANVPLTLCAELDRRQISLREVLELNVGSIVSLTRPAGENIDLYAADILLGSGEVLVIDSSLAVRIAELKDKPPEQQTAAEAVQRLHP